jgi:hypothetical protein
LLELFFSTHYFLLPLNVTTEKWGKGSRDIIQTKKNWIKVVEIVKNNPQWKLAFQIHKELGIQ